MMRNAEECLAEAERCEQQARACANVQFGKKLRKIAEKWRGLAAQAAESRVEHIYQHSN
jgi:hypothetical protein